MRSTKRSIAARASSVLEESEGSGVPLDEETSPQDVSDGDMKSPAMKKGEGGKTTTAKKKKKKKDGIVDKADGDKNRKAAFSSMKPVASTNKPPCAPRGKAKTAYKESEESKEDEESEYHKTTTAKKKTSTNKPPCATRGKAKMAYEESEEDKESEYEEEENYNERMVIKRGRRHPPP